MWPRGTGSNDTVGNLPSDNEGYFAGVQSSGNTSAAATAEDAQVVEELSFSTLSLVQVVVYCILFVVAAGGNVPVFVTLLRNRHRKSRIKLMIMHLAIADLIVTFVMIPVEVIWRITGQWVAGDLMCKLMQTMRAFGPYLSSAVLVCISVDRYFAVLHPLKVHDAHRRGKIMLGVAWYASLVCSVPQETGGVTCALTPPWHPAIFSSVDNTNMEDWLTTYESVSAHNKLDDRAKLSNVPFYLAGVTSLWHNNHERDLPMRSSFKTSLGGVLHRPSVRKLRAESCLQKHAQQPGKTQGNIGSREVHRAAWELTQFDHER
nr:adipokinetic hormone/corazonin-related peptide receptor variant I-like [Dermacentor andersoni]